jgi:hypothetical protein
VVLVETAMSLVSAVQVVLELLPVQRVSVVLAVAVVAEVLLLVVAAEMVFQELMAN